MEETNKYTLKLKKEDFIDGYATKYLKINFDRDRNIPVNPIKITITDINASLGDITGGDSSDKSVTFVYARAHVPDSRVGYISVYYEVYCNFRTGCSKGFGRESEEWCLVGYN